MQATFSPYARDLYLYLYLYTRPTTSRWTGLGSRNGLQHGPGERADGWTPSVVVFVGRPVRVGSGRTVSPRAEAGRPPRRSWLRGRARVGRGPGTGIPGSQVRRVEAKELPRLRAGWRARASTNKLLNGKDNTELPETALKRLL